MRYVQLRAFHYVAIHGGFSRAANELLLTQPAISDQVRKLEEEYDILLFSRQRKQVVLTPAGEQLLAITRRMFETETQALELLSESRALRSGRLAIMADAVHHVLPILTAFRLQYPWVKVVVRSGNTETVTRALMSYEADIGVIGDMPPMRDTEVIHLNSSPIVACVAVGHPLAAAGRVSLADLAPYPLVAREQGSKTRKKVEDAAQARGITLSFAIEAEGREAMREILAMGLGVGFVSEAEFGHDPRLVPLTIDGAPVAMDEVMICLKERAEAKTIRAFLETARGLETSRDLDAARHLQA
jgi:aminoethylphosphonate catabolism LysR family transcriptional regulator